MENIPKIIIWRKCSRAGCCEASMQGRGCVMVLGTDKVKVQNVLVGGGFGGKEDMTVQPFAALAAYLLQKPVKVKLSRAESLLVHPKRHPFINGRHDGMR